MEDIKRVQLSEIAGLITKGTTPTTLGYEFQEDGVNFLKIECFDENGGFIESKVAHISEECNEKLKRSQLKAGDVLFSIAGAIGRVAIVTEEMLPANTNQALAIIRIADEQVYLPYIKLILTSPIVIEQFEKKKQGVAQLNLSLKDINEISIPLPSKEKQIELAELFDKVAGVIAKRKTEISALDDLIKARFVELFGLPVSNTKGWKTEQMGEVAPAVNYKGEFDDEVWLLNLDMVEAQTGRILDYLVVSEEEVGNSTCTFDTSNVLYSKLRPYLNKVVIPDRCGYATSELVPLQPVKTKINREYLAFMLRSDEFVNMINEKVAGAKMPRVPMGDFRKFDVPVPPMELQEQFADFVNQVDKSKVAVQKALDETQLLFDSLMQKYFG
ncbi:MAG: restriction endonuclease subunit S [Acetatifactor sp.]